MSPAESTLRKSLISFAPLALCALIGNAFADDSNVTLYGILDEAVANIEHSLNLTGDHPVGGDPRVTKGTQSATGFINGGMSATRWGIKGQEDMGGGLKAVFLLEEGFNMGSGQVSNAAAGLANNGGLGPNMSADSAISGQMFNRGAYVGLSSTSWGTVTFGRQQSFFLDNIAIFDPLLGSQAFSPIGFSGAYGGGGYTDDSRVDDSVKYKLPIGDFTIGALYKFGGVAGASSAESGEQLNLVYASGPLAVQAGYQAFKDGFSLANVNGSSAVGTGTLAATAADTSAFMISGKYKIEASGTTIKAGWERETFKDPSNPTQDKAMTSVFGYTITTPNVTAFQGANESLNTFWVGGQQDFTPAFSLLLGLYRTNQNQFAGATTTSTGAATTANTCAKAGKYCSGALDFYSLALDYHFSKRTDTYFGAMLSKVSGGPAAAVVVKNSSGAIVADETSNRIIAVGIRHVF
jgi:predicted porin